ncbi:MAG: diaminopimelate epimerase [Bacteroidota bacterium]
MQIPFYKYQGTGNDFVIIDQRAEQYLKRGDYEIVQQMCNRRFGIGADGLILLENHEVFDFKMIYFNADGHESSMCGNGGRCIIAFAKYLAIIERTCTFLAIDGPHDGLIHNDGIVELKMSDVNGIQEVNGDFVLDTGSPHYIAMCKNVDDIDVVKEGQKIRYSEKFKKEGINVNFVERVEGELKVATYERGVENETLSCGTGVTAAALAYAQDKTIDAINIQSKGGPLRIKFEKTEEGGFENIWLCGPAEKVFKGDFLIK